MVTFFAQQNLKQWSKYYHVKHISSVLKRIVAPTLGALMKNGYVIPVRASSARHAAKRPQSVG
ncbi:hypothetical protein AYY26_21470 [Photobacterium phosphoreum]|nr:hypothetical protein AYY26_21470 [Photobacterium phosphoreum]